MINPVSMWNFDAAKAAVVRTLDILRACAFAAEKQGEAGQHVIHDLIVPNMNLLAQFCENVKVERNPSGMSDAEIDAQVEALEPGKGHVLEFVPSKPFVEWRAKLSAKSKATIFKAIGEISDPVLAERWRERAREELHEVRLDPEDAEGGWWECTLDIRGIVELEVLLSAARDRPIGVELWCYTKDGTAMLGDCESRFWSAKPEK